MAPYSLYNVIQVSRGPKIPKWFEHFYLHPQQAKDDLWRGCMPVKGVSNFFSNEFWISGLRKIMDELYGASVTFIHFKSP